MFVVDNCGIEEPDNILFPRRVDGESGRAGATAPDRVCNLIDLFGRASGDQDVTVVGRKATAERRSEAILGADAYDNSLRKRYCDILSTESES